MEVMRREDYERVKDFYENGDIKCFIEPYTVHGEEWVYIVKPFVTSTVSPAEIES